ncbi:hypothetical protein AAVH_30853 [Aphelenchoides avenae]|nr:hypothetical protein AAVH_30853 [Aphelenchus avenae]
MLMSSHARNAPTFSCENARTKELLLIRPPVSLSEANAFFVERRKFDVLVDKPSGSLDNLMAFLRRLT